MASILVMMTSFTRIVIVLATRGRLFLYVGVVAPFRAVPTAVAVGQLPVFAHPVAVAEATGEHLDGADVNLGALGLDICLHIALHVL